MTRPFLFNYLVPCSTREPKTDDARFWYNPRTGLLMVHDEREDIPAILSPEGRRPVTKKADIEKGDDQKDSPRPRPRPQPDPRPTPRPRPDQR